MRRIITRTVTTVTTWTITWVDDGEAAPEGTMLADDRDDAAEWDEEVHSPRDPLPDSSDIEQH